MKMFHKFTIYPITTASFYFLKPKDRGNSQPPFNELNGLSFSHQIEHLRFLIKPLTIALEMKGSDNHLLT